MPWSRTLPRETAARVMKLKLRWDKYADPEKKEFQRIKEAVESVDVFGLITAELAKSRINEAVTRRLVSAVRVLDSPKRGADFISSR